MSDSSNPRTEEAQIRPPTNLTVDRITNIADAFTIADFTPEHIAEIKPTRRPTPRRGDGGTHTS